MPLAVRVRSTALFTGGAVSSTVDPRHLRSRRLHAVERFSPLQLERDERDTQCKCLALGTGSQFVEISLLAQNHS
jgi:hypothetical protein